jgi:metallo-beta-lactamase class B
MKKYLSLWLLSFTGLFCCARKPGSNSTYKLVFAQPELRILQVAPHAYVHITYLQTDDFGKVPCNGLVVVSEGESVIFDTPANDADSERLIRWVNDSLKVRIKAVVPTHFHNDCLGGLPAFQAKGIPNYAYMLTQSLAKESKSAVPEIGFRDSLNLRFGKDSVLVRFHGEGHTRDNVVAWFAKEKVLFGGCLVKEIGASKGYLGDANLKAWSATVAAVKQRYPAVQVVIPGHGAPGPQGLLDYTIQLFSESGQGK